jgi:hypothetical protein
MTENSRAVMALPPHLSCTHEKVDDKDDYLFRYPTVRDAWRDLRCSFYWKTRTVTLQGGSDA